ncbi:hypothetical protein NQ317_017583 [Molorchus minor]|uniref:ADAMTS/ADAMTS-like Spacer 1 domain-containing protein n=1 Tax=Molorchus minor TaxID=1323400 RepID=A0ABQ9JSJ1_9CUCU|nr:hypothetical protein NQ317_017583 [Molorchus minor]
MLDEIRQIKDKIALKNSNGSFIVNGEWKFSNSRALQGAGAKFIYVRQDENSLETLSSPGPLANTVDVMIVNYQANPGIKYSYSLPINEQPVIAPPLVKRPYIDPTSLETKRLDSSAANTSLNQKDEARPPLHPGPRRTRTRRKYFHWKVTGLTACSKPCGGGIQTYVKTCYKELHPHNIVPVNDRRCSHLENPASEPVRCNMDPCPPTWEGYWTECSSSCGEGIQEYILQCKQDLATGAVVVNGDQCPQPKPSGQTRPCRERECESSHDNELPQIEDPRNMREWSVGPWSQVSAPLKTGQHTQNTASLTPATLHRVHDPPPPSTRSLSTWLLTEWSQCSEFCGTGTQTRLTVCGTGNQNECDSDSRPELFRACSSDKQCGGEWFTGCLLSFVELQDLGANVQTPVPAERSKNEKSSASSKSGANHTSPTKRPVPCIINL